MLRGANLAVAQRGAPIRGALKNGQLFTLGGDGLNDLDTGRAGADDADALAREIDRFFRPAGAVQRQTGEVFHSCIVRKLVGRQQPGGADHVARLGAHPVVGRNLPALVRFVVHDGRHARVALDVTLQIEFVRDKMQIPLHFRLAREVLAPLPFVDQFLGKGVLVGIALGVETGAWVAIPVPGAADIGAGLEHPRREAELAEFIESIQAGHAGTDDDSIILLGHDQNLLWSAISLHLSRRQLRVALSSEHPARTGPG